MGARWISRSTRMIAVALAGVLLVALSACGNAGSVARSSATATAVRATATATVALGGQPVSWTVVTNIPANTVSFMIAPSDPRIAYLCASDGPAAAPLPATSRLYTSIDGGQSWQLITTAPTLVPVSGSIWGQIAVCRTYVDPSDPHDVFYEVIEDDTVTVLHAIARALYRSRDGGATWQQLAEVDGTDSFRQISMLGTRLVAQAEPRWPGGARRCDPTIKPTPVSNLYNSDDGGMTWHALGQDIESQGYSVKSLAMAGSVLFAVGEPVPPNECTFDYTSALWTSSDSGNTWSRVTVPLSNITVSLPEFTAKATGTGYYGVSLAYTFASGTSNVSSVTTLYSSDSGATWVQFPFPTWTELSGIKYGVPVVSPTGTVLTIGGVNHDQIVAFRPSDPTPAWIPYAPASYYPGQIIVTPQGATMWSVVADTGNGAHLATLPLP